MLSPYHRPSAESTTIYLVLHSNLQIWQFLYICYHCSPPLINRFFIVSSLRLKSLCSWSLAPGRDMHFFFLNSLSFYQSPFLEICSGAEWKQVHYLSILHWASIPSATASLEKSLKNKLQKLRHKSDKRSHWVLNLISKPALLFWVLFSSYCLGEVDVKW